MAEYRDLDHIDPNKEYQISELAKYIREKMYGVDVRESIALALERVYDDAAQKGNANMEVVKARGFESTLGGRLDRMQDDTNDNKSLLTRKVDRVELDVATSKINFYGNGNLIDDVDITEAGNSSFVQEYIDSLVSEGKIEGIALADGGVTTEKYADNSITNEKLDKNYTVKSYLNSAEYDLDYIIDEGNYMINADVKNNFTGALCSLNVERYKLDKDNNNLYNIQILSVFGSGNSYRGKTFKRLIQRNEASGVILFRDIWRDMSVEDVDYDALLEDFKTEIGMEIINMNWAQIEHNFNFTENKLVRRDDSGNGYYYADSNVFKYSDPIPVIEGDIYRIITRSTSIGNWTTWLRGIFLNDNDEYIGDIPTDGDDPYCGISTFKIPKGATKMIVNALMNRTNQSQTHILKLHDWENIWNSSIGFTKDRIINNNGEVISTSRKQGATNDIPVEPGEIIRLADTHNGDTNNLLNAGVFLNANNEVVKPVPNTGNSLPYPWNDVIVPAGATKMRINFYYELLTKSDVENTMTINKAIPAKPYYSTDFRKVKGKVWAAYGDSVTYYADWVRLVENATGLSVYIHGHSSASINDYRPGNDNYLARDDRIEALMASDPDVVTILTGGNSGDTELGSKDDFRKQMGDEDITTFYGAYAYTIKKILTIKPTVKIILIEAKYRNTNNNDDAPNSHGLTSLDFSNATADVARYFGLSLVNSRTMGANFFTSNLMLRDNVHLTMRGAESLAGTVLNEVKKVSWISS